MEGTAWRARHGGRLPPLDALLSRRSQRLFRRCRIRPPSPYTSIHEQPSATTVVEWRARRRASRLASARRTRELGILPPRRFRSRRSQRLHSRPSPMAFHENCRWRRPLSTRERGGGRDGSRASRFFWEFGLEFLFSSPSLAACGVSIRRPRQWRSTRAADGEDRRPNASAAAAAAAAAVDGSNIFLRWWCVCLMFVALCLFVVFARRIRKCVGGAVCVRWQGVWFGALVVCRAHGCGISEEA